VGTLTVLAVALPRTAGAAPGPVADIAVTAALGACSVRLFAAGRPAWASAYAVASLVWTAVGLAPLLAPEVVVAVSRWAMVPHAIVVTTLAALLVPRRPWWPWWSWWSWWPGCSAVIAAAAGSGLPLPPLLSFGVLLLLAAGLRRVRAMIVVATVASGLALVVLDQRVLGAEIEPRVLVVAVDAVLVGMAVLVTFSLTEDQLTGRGFEPTGDPGGVTRALARAVGSPDLALAFPDGRGSALDLSGQPVVPPVHATSVPGADGHVIAWLSPPVDAPLTGSLVGLLDSLGAVARMRRRQLDQAEEVSASRSRLQAAADEESRTLERQLERSVMSRLATMRQLVAGTSSPELVSRVDEVRDELLGHARGLDPLAGRTLGQALATHVERGVTVNVDPMVTDPVVARTAWYVATEALTNAAKHAGGSGVSVSVRSTPPMVEVVVADRGPGGADPAGAGLVGLADRVQAAGGTVEVTSTSAGTTVSVRLPDPGNPSAATGSPACAGAAGTLGSRP
jgi:two-component sensor histidine kinase